VRFDGVTFADAAAGSCHFLECSLTGVGFGADFARAALRLPAGLLVGTGMVRRGRARRGRRPRHGLGSP
jgi:hypothetical protein